MTIQRVVGVLLVLLALYVGQISTREFGAYSNSFVYLTAANKVTKEQVQICANYQQFRSKDGKLAETFETSKGHRIGWWNGRPNNTKICPLPDARVKPIDFENKIVPLEYRIDDDGTTCTRPFVSSPTAFRNASQYQENQLKTHNAAIALFILDRGRQFVAGWKDYLFSDFYDPYISATNAIPTFFIYRTDFKEKILKLATDGDLDDFDLELHFHRPLSHQIDASMIIIWLIAMICVAGGGTWAFWRHKNGKDLAIAEATSSSSNSTSGSSTGEENNSRVDKFCAKYGNYVAIAILMGILIGVIMLGYYFRSVLVIFFNILLVIFGTSSVHGCIRAFFSNFEFSAHRWYNAKIEWIPKICGQTHNFTYTGAASVILALSFCATWYFMRLTPYAFILLDIINITVCLHILKSLRLPSLKWICILMSCMFVYDAFMVFATPLWTKNGCSVMLEVATGMDCSNSRNNFSGYPLPPIDIDAQPEKFPMLMQVMHFDPMISCIDLEVEKNYQMTILGLGDIIIPGYLVAHCFTMNGFEEKTRLLYGLVCVIGYGVGLIATFVALSLMRMAQPALIYLVPFTLGPVCIFALFRREFGKVWNGVPMDKQILIDGHSPVPDNNKNDADDEDADEPSDVVDSQPQLLPV